MPRIATRRGPVKPSIDAMMASNRAGRRLSMKSQSLTAQSISAQAFYDEAVYSDFRRRGTYFGAIMSRAACYLCIVVVTCRQYHRHYVRRATTLVSDREATHALATNGHRPDGRS